MRAKSAPEWLAVYRKEEIEGLSAMPKVFRDGHVLPKAPPLEVFRRRQHNPVPVMIGTNRDENKLYLFYDELLVRRWFGVIPRMREPRLYHTGAEYRKMRGNCFGCRFIV